MDEIKTYLAAIAIADSIEAAHEVFIEAIQSLNFTHTIYGFAFRETDVEKTLYALFGNFPEEFYKPYFELGGLVTHTAAATMFNSETILNWQSEEYAALVKEKGEATYKIEKFCRDLGFITGATLAFWVREDFIFVCAVTVRGDDKDDCFSKKAEPNLDLVKLLCKAMSSKLLGEDFNLLSNPLVKTNYVSLRADELNYLSHKMNGLKDKEVNLKMHKSKKTFELYARKIKKSLKAKDFRKALLRARIMKLKEPAAEEYWV